ncbi:conjugal transfer protein [Streptomyces sp. H10-C2]|uniref:conjugal transfer protein n=1 Tax=unclassified Streptomyces TaxID=2593676 RepID=UPI0024BB6530|nr:MULTISPECIES: conjugal transfer protein [unclassified Streptomyces]MDJ0345555.1 conjugal transfer protein [Streptomyces sp. PH10-H1]MDJ0374501.1 conjugal transfer protein [Streptomyces sp. H10-C2]
MGSVVRMVLGLPEPKAKQVDNAAPNGAVIAPRSDPEQRPANPWESAAAQLQQQRQPAGRPAAVSTPAPAAPWATHEERSGALFARRFGRGLLWAVVILAAITGVRAWIWPPTARTAAPPPVKSAPAYPSADAQAVAARFARAYLTWDDTKPAERAALLAAVLPASADTAMGWNNKGKQDVLAAYPGAVTLGSQNQARVRVDVLVLPAATGQAPPTTPAPAASHWLGLDVPVVATAGRVIVTGPPGLVGIPATGPKAPELATSESDGALTTATQTAVETFFRAYAGGDTESVTAPGATLPPLPEGVKFEGLGSWSADAGSGTDRTGTARVSWTIGGATVEMVYRVELTRVSSADAQRWQVANIHGGTA